MAEKVLFDPGFAPLVDDFYQSIDIVKQIMTSVPSMHQKKFKYKMLQADIIKLVKNNVAFYFGCMLWAYYLVNNFKNEPKELEGNTFSDLSEEEKAEYDFFGEIDFITDYFAQYKKDTKYYLGKEQELPKEWFFVLQLYREFLELNNSFLKAKLTSDIVLPEKIANINVDFDIKEIIEFSIMNKSIENLLELNIFA